MKKFLVPIVMLVILVGFCTWTVWQVDQICQETSSLLEQAETRCTLGDFEGAGALVYRSQCIWNCREGFLGMALRHTESDDVGILFPPLLDTCRQRDAEEFSRRNLELMATLKHLSRMEIPYYFNIL